MYINKFYSFRLIMRFSGRHIVWLTCWALLVVLLYYFGNLKWLNLSWLPISLVGTAVAFYVGFKNDSSYDRMWEARKTWSDISSLSRAWAINVKSYIGHSPALANSGMAQQGRQRLVYRHIAWLYTLRQWLLKPQPWEHINQKGHWGTVAEGYQSQLGLGLFQADTKALNIEKLLSPDELQLIKTLRNPAIHIIDLQAQDLKALLAADELDTDRHIELQNLLNTLCEKQGQLECIKKFPLPRQYANMSSVFIGIFIFLLPFGLMSELSKLGDYGIWLVIPSTVLLGWIFMIMELVGDYSENPFQGLPNDIPMLAICRTIEIDLREMLGESNLPQPIAAKQSILM